MNSTGNPLRKASGTQVTRSTKNQKQNQIAESKQIQKRHREKQHLAPLYEITMPAEDLGLAFFFHHYAIVGPQCSACDTTFARLCRLAVGMAGAATSRKDVAMMAQARFKYELSLQHLVRAIENPAEMTAASTLAAVTELSMFEVCLSRSSVLRGDIFIDYALKMITCESYSSMDAYLYHIGGIGALIKRWGRSDWISLGNLSGGLHVMFLVVSYPII